MRTVRFQRASATTPGKHGDLDWRVTLDGNPPTHAEMVFMLGMILLAEERYNRPTKGQLNGRHLLWYFVDLLISAKSPERVIEIAEACADVKKAAAA